MITNGFPTDFVLFEYIESCPFFDYQPFTLENFKKYDPNYKLNKLYYETFIKHMPEIRSEKKTIDEQIVYIDVCFSDSKFLEKLSRIKMKEEFPNLKEKDIIIKPNIKSIEDLKEEKSQEIKNRKKINLNKIAKNKDDDFRFDIE